MPLDRWRRSAPAHAGASNTQLSQATASPRPSGLLHHERRPAPVRPARHRAVRLYPAARPRPPHLYGGSYSDDDLRWWADRIREWQAGGRRLRVLQQRRRRQRRPERRHTARAAGLAATWTRRGGSVPRRGPPRARPEPGTVGEWRHGHGLATSAAAARVRHQRLPAGPPVSDTVNGDRLKTGPALEVQPADIAYQGYGSTGWVRVLGRVVLTSRPAARQPGGAAALNGNQNFRGWRAFTSVPVAVHRGGDQDRRRHHPRACGPRRPHGHRG